TICGPHHEVSGESGQHFPSFEASPRATSRESGSSCDGCCMSSARSGYRLPARRVMYRDGKHGLERKLQERREEIAALLAELDGARRFVLPPDLLRQLTLAEGPLFTREDPKEGAVHLARLRDEARKAVEYAREIPVFELRWKEPFPLLYEEPFQLEALAVFE